MASFGEKFKAGFEIGIKAKSSHLLEKRAQKDVIKSATKWEDKKAKAEKKAEKDAAKTRKKAN